MLTGVRGSHLQGLSFGLAAVIVLTTLTGSLAYAAQTDAEPAFVDPEPAESAAERTSPREEARQAEEAARVADQLARQARRQRGTRPIAEQLQELTGTPESPVGQPADTPYVVATLSTPMPLKVYAAIAQDLDVKFSDTVRTTAYLELDDGYPFTMSGPLGADYLSALNALMSDTAAKASRSIRSSEAAADHSAEAPSPEIRQYLEQFISSVEAARAQLPDRTVVLGFTMPLDEYNQQRARLDSLGLAAAEVELNYDARPFKNVDELLVPETVERFVDMYEEDEHK